MTYKIREEKDYLILEGLKDFDPEHIFECGQAFRWKREEDGSYTAVAYGRLINVKKKDGIIIARNTNKDDFVNIWHHYFDLDTDYGKIKELLSRDPILKEAIDFGQGIRILNQEPFETTISFIISANNQIPRIKKSINIIAREYGEYIGDYRGEAYYSFPDPKTLSQVDVKELREVSRVGFRDQRIIDTSKLIAEGDLDLDSIFHMEKDEGKKELMKLPGVGPKVSDCILLFAFDKENAFPVDVWVKRIMEHLYLKEETPLSKIGKKGDELFGSLAGYAQQYLFYYARELDIGK